MQQNSWRDSQVKKTIRFPKPKKKETSDSFPETHGISLDLRYDTPRQYYICIQTDRNEVLPEVFINVYRKRNKIECQTLDLVKLNQKITDAHYEVISMSDQTIQDLLREVCTGIAELYRVSEAISMLDMLAAFAQLATNYDYIRPELTSTLAIKAGRHPIREQIHSSKFIPNDAYATLQTRFQIITGCNMSGKSTYIRSLALMTVMAQIGCFVPAKYASFPIVHQLFARVAASDELDANVSTFAAEMREMAFILRNLQHRGMIIVDELGRGTSTTDGLAIAVALAEALLASNALVWFATHFHDLGRILSERSGVINLHLAANIADDASKITMLYQIAEGPVPDRRYGLALAKLVDLPPAVLEVAEKVSGTVDHIEQKRNCKSRTVVIAKKRRLLLSLREQLLIARKSAMDDETLRRWMIKLQKEFSTRMTSLEEESESASDVDSDSLALDLHPTDAEQNPERELSNVECGQVYQSPTTKSTIAETITISSDSEDMTSDAESVVLI